VKNETAEAVADITSTGETLRANHLRLLDDGPALKSQATLLRSKSARMTKQEHMDLKALLGQLSLT
jgi:ATP phosphoribosyltransferase